ncbi:MAG: endo-1,4-beta-xylanase [Treponema sp.]|jgi:GH35 family endo-1,4-beta-xylanase|nr:endo-1,4-beta-xylanase [Treponema sp.]
MVLRVRILNAQGCSESRDTLASLFATDLGYLPFRRKSEISREGVIRLTVPDEPVILHAKLPVPGYGFLWIVADNCGAGYGKDMDMDFAAEAARSRAYEVEQVIAGGDFTASAKCLSMLNDAESLLKQGENADTLKRTECNITALAAALWAGDLAAVERAKTRIAAGKKRDRFLFGCAGFNYPYENLPGVRDLFDGVFNFATLPFYLSRVEWERGKPDYAPLDALQDMFEKAGITTKGHPLWWAHTAGMPPWTRDLHWEDGSIKREIDRVITDRVKRYQGRIRLYDIINEAHDWCNGWMMSQSQLAEMTKACADAVHNQDGGCKAVVNTCFMFGENAADPRVQWGVINERNMTPYSYLEKVEELGTQYEAIGMQLYCPNRDMLAIDKLYDRFKVFNKPYHITELGVPSCERDVPPNTTEGDLYCLRYMYKGLWHEMGWSERLQADWLEDFYTLSYARPEVEALTWWSLHDGQSYVPAAGLVHEDGTPKESIFRLKELEKSWGFSR